jgi:dynein heavy chain
VQAVDKSSKACSGICMWVRAMYKYYTVALQVEPKKKKLAEAQESLDKTMAALNAAQAKLKDVEERIVELETTFMKTQAQKEQLARDVEVCRARLVRAQKLVGGLGGEKDRCVRTLCSCVRLCLSASAVESVSHVALLCVPCAAGWPRLHR